MWTDFKNSLTWHKNTILMISLKMSTTCQANAAVVKKITVMQRCSTEQRTVDSRPHQ